ncbi:hypothetical protein GTO27_00490, partial [Candidatus Bathyarchaeota archaeon]|nr:hypothetical protein [Candidatus Bathyarchaeota archaeon]
MLDHEHIDWTPGNGRIDVWGETGFYPNGEVEIWLENELYGIEIHLKTVTADNYGRFYTIIHHLPEVPRKPTCDDHWFVRAVDEKGNKGADHFAIIPWITYEDTMAQDNPETWQTTKKGYVDDTIIVYGHGFLPSRQDNWDPYCTVYVRIYYCGVAPRVYDQISQKRRVFNGTSQFNWDNLEWYPRLSETVLAEVQTDENGYWQAEIKIPQSYGGLHAIYACEYRIVADPARTCPNGELDLICSGWPQCTEIEKEAQSVILDVWPTIKVFPSTALTNQYVTVEGEGLPLPRYYQLWMNGESIVEDRDWCLVLDFGPYKQWIFENKRIRNNELDLAWVDEVWYPFSFYTPDIGAFLESPVWKGKLTSITKDYTIECTESYQFHIGSKYLQVPVLPADSYEVMIYYYDKNSQKFIHDHHAITSIEVLKDPLNVHMEVGGIHFPEETVDVTVHVDVDGIDTDVTSLVFALYKGESFFENLNYDRISTGFYVATFNCPAGEGDYFIKASVAKEYESFTLYGSAITSFTVSPTLNGLNAKLLALEGELATLITDMGEMKVNLSRINARIEAVSGDIVTIETSIGTLQTDISNINGKLVGIEGTIVTINTDIGILKENAKDL